MSQESDIKTLQDDAIILAKAQVARDWNDKAVKWLIGILLSALIGVGSFYGKWINDSIRNNEQSISRVEHREALRDENLDILDSKIDVILHYHGLQYNGPAYKKYELVPNPTQENTH